MAELLLPAGNIESLRAAVANGADAVYLGLSEFSARASAENFNEKNIYSAVKFCHDENVKVYVAFNTLVKNSELSRYFSLMGAAYNAGADAVIIQDANFIPIIKSNFPGLKIHMSTQAFIMNVQSIPKGADRVILPRECKVNDIALMSEKIETEAFIHGALCISYSGLGLFSSISGGRSGNRGVCAQPCRKKYNGKYLLSTMDLCMAEKLDELLKLGVSSLKVEGRLRSALYVGTVARIYRKILDSGKCNENDIKELKIVFNRGFTTGFAFNDSIVDSRNPMNRGLFIGRTKNNQLKLNENINAGDGLCVWNGGSVNGFRAEKSALKGGIIKIEAEDYSPVFITSSVALKAELGKELRDIGRFSGATVQKELTNKIALPQLYEKKLGSKHNTSEPDTSVMFFAKAYSAKQAKELDGKADVIYCDISIYEQLSKEIKKSKLFCFTPKILSSGEAEELIGRINQLKVKGILVSNRALLCLENVELHLDYCLNTFNDYDIINTPILSPELSFSDIKTFRNKNFICMVHGDIVMMTTKEPVKAPELIDDEGRHFRVRAGDGYNEILNCLSLGLFNHVLELHKIGVRQFYIDSKDSKWVRIYKKILEGGFDDRKIRKGYTTGNYINGID